MTTCISRFVLTATVLASAGASASNGLYFGFNLGGGITLGDRGILLKDPTQDPDYKLTLSEATTDYGELVRTDAGSGFSGEFRLGYNIFGMVAIELDLGGSFENLSESSKFGTNFGAFGLVRLFPAQFFEEVADRWWDPYIFLGGGVHAVIYKPDAHPPVGMRNKARAWFPSGAIKYGLGCDFYPVPFLSLGLDVSFTNGFHETFVIDFEKDITTSSSEDARSMNVQISASLLFHFDFSRD